MTRPSENPAWAESAPASNIDEPVAQRSDGYDAGEPFANSQANWLFRTFGRWISWLDGGATEPTVKTAIDATTPGDTVVVDTYDPSLRPFSVVDTTSAQGADEVVADMATDGRWLYVYFDSTAGTPTGRIARLDPDDLTVETDIFNVADTSVWGNTEFRVATDGELIVAIVDDEIRAWDTDTLTQQWTQVVSSDLVDVAINAHHVYAIENGTGDQVYQLDYATGSVDANVGGILSGTPVSLAVSGAAVFVVNDDGSDYKLYRLTPDSLNLDSQWGTNPAVETSADPWGNGLATDGDRIYVSTTGGVVTHRAADGIEAAESDAGAGGGRGSRITQDGSRCIVAENRTVFYVDKTSGLETDADAVTLGADIDALVSDGERLYIAYANGQIATQITGRRPQMWRRVSADDRYRQPFYTLLVPAE